MNNQLKNNPILLVEDNPLDIKTNLLLNKHLHYLKQSIYLMKI